MQRAKFWANIYHCRAQSKIRQNIFLAGAWRVEKMIAKI
jgi:hypothetical protein